jgi:hypothetical protein
MPLLIALNLPLQLSCMSVSLEFVFFSMGELFRVELGFVVGRDIETRLIEDEDFDKGAVGSAVLCIKARMHREHSLVVSSLALQIQLS